MPYHFHETKIFLGLVIAPAAGAWHEISDREDIESAYESARAFAASQGAEELEIADSEGPIPLHGLGFDELVEVVEWLHDDGRRYSESLIKAAYAYDRTNYQKLCENAMGPYESLSAYAEQCIDDMWHDVPSWLACHIDYKSLGSDIAQDMIQLDTDDGLYLVDGQC